MAEWTNDTMYAFLGIPEILPVVRLDGFSTTHAPQYLVMPTKSTHLLPLCYEEVDICLV
jgi:hypothetical protein